MRKLMSVLIALVTGSVMIAGFGVGIFGGVGYVRVLMKIAAGERGADPEALVFLAHLAAGFSVACFGALLWLSHQVARGGVGKQSRSQ